MTEHVLSEPRQLRYPGGKNGMWIVACSCEYRTHPYSTAAAALKPAEAHLKAMTGDRGEPHLFHFAVSVQGANDDWTGEPFKLTVRAWNLQEACARAAEVPFPEWLLPSEDLVGDLLPEGDGEDDE